MILLPCWFLIPYHSLPLGDVNTVVEPFPFELENGTEPFGTGRFSCLLSKKFNFPFMVLTQLTPARILRGGVSLPNINRDEGKGP